MAKAPRSQSNFFFLPLALAVCLLQVHGPSSHLLNRQEPRPRSRIPVGAFGSSPAEIFEQAERLKVKGGEASLRRAEALYRLAIQSWRSAGDLAAESKSWSRLAEVRRSLGNLQGALVAFDTASRQFRTLGEREREVEALNSQGRILRLLGRLAEAKDVYDRSLRNAREIGFLPGEAVAHNNLGMLWYYTGAIDLALPSFRRALAIWLQLGEKSRAATTLSNIGSTYLLGGRVEDAVEFLQRSLALATSAGDKDAEANALTELGWCRYLRRDYRGAIGLFQRAITIRRDLGDRLGEASALDRLGSAQRELGSLERAQQSYRLALSILVESGSLLDQAHTLSNLCQLALARRRGARPEPTCERALALFRRTGDRNGEAHALYLNARLLAQEGRLEEAAQVGEQVLDLLDALWTRAEGPRLRTSYLESRYTYYEFYISLLMKLHRFHPEHGYDLLALQASERARSRNLLETVLESRLARGDFSRRDAGNFAMAAKGGGLGLEILTPSAAGGQRAMVEALSLGHSLDIKKIRSTVLGPETLLLVYSIGDQASYLWWLSRDEFGSHTLPGRRKLERLVLTVRALLMNPKAEPVQSLLALDALGELLLGPSPVCQRYQRLILVPDGPIHYLPFGALAAPMERSTRRSSAATVLKSWRPLLAHHDLVVVPSLSALQILKEGRQRGNRTIAVFADPVFSPDDPRVDSAQKAYQREYPTLGEIPVPGSVEDLRRSAEAFHLKDWPRLPGSRAEAIRIQSWVAPQDRFIALDFAARREDILNKALADYQVLHFATHSLLNERVPELSGIVLSMVDRNGQPLNGFLRASDVLHLRLSAELVVLSGCRTALGRETRGEGLIGLSQAFFVAGARNLVVSLWDVDDRATSELMTRFYYNLFGRRLAPSVALQAAQSSLLAEERFKAPYYWAAFVLVGEGDPWVLSRASLNNP